MIFGLPKLYAYGAAALVVALLAGGIYGAGYNKAKDKYRGQLYAERAEAKAAYDAKVAETARIQAEWDRILGERDELRKELAAARDYGKSVGDRLRNYQGRRCALPDTTGVAAGTERAAQIASLVERIRRLDERISDLNGRVIEACSGEAKQLETLLDRYEAARQVK